MADRFRGRGSLVPAINPRSLVVDFDRAARNAVDTGLQVFNAGLRAKQGALRAKAMTLQLEKLEQDQTNIAGLEQWSQNNKGTIYMSPPDFLGWFDRANANTNPLVRRQADIMMTKYQQRGDIAGPGGQVESPDFWFAKLRSGELDSSDFKGGIILPTAETAAARAGRLRALAGPRPERTVALGDLFKARASLLERGIPEEDSRIEAIDSQISRTFGLDPLDVQIEVQRQKIEEETEKAKERGLFPPRRARISETEQAAIDAERAKLNELLDRKAALQAPGPVTPTPARIPRVTPPPVISAGEAAVALPAPTSALVPARRERRPPVGALRTFTTVEEAEAANLPSGTEIIIGNRRAIVE